MVALETDKKILALTIYNSRNLMVALEVLSMALLRYLQQ